LEKVFTVRNFNVTVSGISPEYQPGDDVTIKVHVEDITNNSIENASISALLIKPLFGPPEEGKEETIVSTEIVNTKTDSSGNAEFNLTINQSHWGITIALISVNYSNKVDEVSYVFITHQPGLTISLDYPQVPFAPNEFIDINISVSGSDRQLAIAPPLPTMERVGESIPESQMMSMGKEIPFMEAPIFLNQTGFTHMKLLTPSKAGKYITMIMFIERNSDWFGPEDMYDVAFVEYDVQ